MQALKKFINSGASVSKLSFNKPQWSSLTHQGKYFCISYSMYAKVYQNVENPVSKEIVDPLLQSNDLQAPQLLTILLFQQEKGTWPNEFAEKVQSKMVNNLSLLKAFDISMLSWIYGNAREGSSDLWHQIEREGLQRLADGSLRKTDLGRLVHGIAQVNKGSESFWIRIQQNVVESIEEFNVEAIAHTIHGLGKVAKKGMKIEKETIKALRRGIVNNIGDLGGQNLVLVIEGLSYLDHTIDKINEELIFSFNQELNSLSNSLFVSGIKGAARLDQGSVKIWKSFRDHALRVLLGCTPHEVSGLAWAFAKVKDGDKILWNAFIKEVKTKMSEFDPDDLVRVLYAFSEMNIHDEGISKLFTQQYGNAEAWKNLKTKSLVRVLTLLEKQKASSSILEELNRHLKEREDWSNYIVKSGDKSGETKRIRI